MPIRKDLRRAFQKFTDEWHIADFIDPAGEALAENLGINLTQSIRQQRNELDAMLEGPNEEIDLLDATDLELSPQQQRNIEASFKAHTRTVLRQIAQEVGKDLESEIFADLDPNNPPVILKLNEYAAGNFPTLGEHPHDMSLAVPIPPSHEDVAQEALERWHDIRQRMAARKFKAKK